MFLARPSFIWIKYLENSFKKFLENINKDSSSARVQIAMSMTMKETIIGLWAACELLCYFTDQTVIFLKCRYPRKTLKLMLYAYLWLNWSIKTFIFSSIWNIGGIIQKCFSNLCTHTHTHTHIYTRMLVASKDLNTV